MAMKPNILFIFSDQHRHDVLGCAGHPLVQTPNLDRLAAEGARFTRTWCQSPVCQSSRACLITGRYTEDLDIFGNTRDFDPDWPTVMRSIQAAGYETASIGKTHYHGMPDRDEIESSDRPFDLGQRYDEYVASFGWDYVLEEYDKYVHASRRVRSPYSDYLEEHDLLHEYREQIKGVYRLTPAHWRGETSCIPQEHDLTSFLANHAIQWLDERNDDRPFFLKLAFVQPHVPLIDDPTWAAHYAGADIPLPDQRVAEGPHAIWGEYLEQLNRHSQVQTMTDEFIRTGIRHYLGMVSLIDQKIGDVVSMLRSQGQLDNTWIIYTADHGEMLGEHHLWAKMNFYNGAVQVPLLIRPPLGCDGREILDLVELTDVTATLAEITGAQPPEGCRGRSLVPALDGESVARELLRSRIYQFTGVRNEQFRFTLDMTTGTPCELFDLQSDPGELNNLVNVSGYSSIIDSLQIAAGSPG